MPRVIDKTKRTNWKEFQNFISKTKIVYLKDNLRIERF